MSPAKNRVTELSTRDNFGRTLAFGLVSSTSFTAMNVIVRLTSDLGNPVLVLFLRDLVIVTFFSVLFFLRYRTLDFSLERASCWLRKFSLLIVASCLTNIAMYNALQGAALGFVAALLATKPAFLIVWARVWEGERTGWRNWFAVILGLSGVAVLLWPADGDFEPVALFALLAAFSGAVVTIEIRALCRQQSVFTVMRSLCAAEFFLLAPIALTQNGPSTATGLIPLALPIAALFMLTAASYTIVGRRGGVSLLAVLELTRLPLASAAGFLFFAEPTTLRTLIGTVIIGVSALAITNLHQRELSSSYATRH